MKSRIFKLLIVLVVLIPAITNAIQYTGGFGYLHTGSAITMPPGALDLSMYIRGFVTIEKQNDETFFISNGSSAIAATFGYTNHTEIAFSQVLYQDLNQTNVGNDELTTMIPGDSYIRFKFGGYHYGSSETMRKVLWGFAPILRLRTALHHDVQFEPYYSRAIELELQYINSFYQKPLYPDDGISIHTNLGYIYHNDGSAENEASAQEFNFLISGVYPREKKFDIGAELYGSLFLVRPLPTVLGREDWMYLTPFVKFKPFGNLSVLLGLDVLLMGAKETSEPTYGAVITDFPNYSSWRLTSRISFAPSTTFYQVSEKGGIASGRPKTTSVSQGISSDYDREALFRWALEQKTGEVEPVDLDLERIRAERKKAEEELELLRKKLEEKNNK